MAGEAQEPTMEEILASIRKIISEDDAKPEPAPEPAPPAARAAPEPAPVDVFDDDEIIELVEEAPKAAAAPVIDFDDIEEEEVLELTDIVARDPLPAADAPEPEPLLSQAAAQVTAESFSHLSGLMVRGYRGSENTLEGLVRDMLRPMLKEWLDANLPDMVEAMVAREISRISGRDIR